MTAPSYRSGQGFDPAEEDPSQTSVGELIGEISDDLSKLFRQEAQKAGKAAGMLGGAGFAGYLTVLFLSLALAWGLGNVMDYGWAALIVAVIWGIVAAVLFVSGKKKIKDVDPMPRRTVETLKEDAQWLKNPTG